MVKVELTESVASSELYTVAKLQEDIEEELTKEDPQLEYARAILNGKTGEVDEIDEI